MRSTNGITSFDPLQICVGAIEKAVRVELLLSDLFEEETDGVLFFNESNEKFSTTSKK